MKGLEAVENEVEVEDDQGPEKKVFEEKLVGLRVDEDGDEEAEDVHFNGVEEGVGGVFFEG